MPLLERKNLSLFLRSTIRRNMMFLMKNSGVRRMWNVKVAKQYGQRDMTRESAEHNVFVSTSPWKWTDTDDTGKKWSSSQQQMSVEMDSWSEFHEVYVYIKRHFTRIPLKKRKIGNQKGFIYTSTRHCWHQTSTAIGNWLHFHSHWNSPKDKWTANQICPWSTKLACL